MLWIWQHWKESYRLLVAPLQQGQLDPEEVYLVPKCRPFERSLRDGGDTLIAATIPCLSGWVAYSLLGDLLSHKCQ